MLKLPSRSDVERWFWRAILGLLFLGVGSWALNWFHSQRDTTSWLHLQPDRTSWIGFLLGIGIWAGVVGGCALLLNATATSKVREFLQAFAAMWRPLFLVVAALYLLFLNDQGRELGVSLLGEKNVPPIIFLFFALIYWGVNNWHTARLGIHAALEHGILGVPPSQRSQLPQENPERRFATGYEPWFYWPPRGLGVCAHLFAAINLSLAAWGLPLSAWGDSDGSDTRWLAWTAPLAILLATAFVWAEDTKRSPRGALSPKKARVARCVKWVATSGELLLLGGLLGVFFHHRGVPLGFLLGTISITLSALVLLGLISWVRRKWPPIGPDASPDARVTDDRAQQKEIRLFTGGLFLIAVLVALAVLFIPTQVGRYLGSMVIACLGFGAILALVNAMEFAVSWTTQKGWYGDAARPRVVGVYAVVFVIGLGVLNAWLHPFHRVRAYDGGACVGDCVPPPPPAGFLATPSLDDRPTVADAARAWYKQAKAAYAKAHGAGPVPMLIVATAGGGIRAAYWTAEVLEKLTSDFEMENGFNDQRGVRPYLFAISGVSGGSVGAVAFEAALAKRDESDCRAGDRGSDKCPLATGFLTADFLAPALANLIFVDTPSSFLPDFGQDDRGTTIEKSFEQASGGLLARPFLSFFRYKKDSGANEEPAPYWRPILLLNATHEETGKRLITGHVLIERNVFLDSLDALHVLGKDVRASTAAHNSARFTYVSPAGDLGNSNGSVIDGGYYENYGALSALEIARAAREALNEEKEPGVKLVILMISSDPGLDKTRTRVRINGGQDGRKCLLSIAEREGQPSGNAEVSRKPGKSPNYLSLDAKQVENAWINEFLAPFQGIKNVREAHGNRAAAELAVEICTEFTEAPKSASGATLASQSPQMQTAATLDEAKDEYLSGSKPAEAGPDNPYFAHLAMCKEAPVQPPLGWVLSKATQDAFGQLLKQCGNDDELTQLKIALGMPALQQAAGP